MNSKEIILNKIRSNKAGKSPLPDIPDFRNASTDLIQAFENSLKVNHAVLYKVRNSGEINDFISKNYSTDKLICSLVAGIMGNFDIDQVNEPGDLKNIELAVLQGEVGVSENAAIWLSEKSMKLRALPFIIQHLILIVNESDIVENMHLAYQKIEIDADGYGVFIAGPSKTADIEQNLVIGAHGARSLTVFVIK